MDDSIFVSCHAPCYSLLQFETSRCKHDQKGFLLGHVQNEIISSTTDENEVHKEEKTAIYIEHILPAPTKLFDNIGGINCDAFNKLEYTDRIIGWYSFRRNSVMKPSVKDKLIHKHLVELLPNVEKFLFTFAILSTSVSQSVATHSFYQVFMRLSPHSNNMIPTKLKINTLSDFSLTSFDYLNESNFPKSTNFDKIINSVKDTDNCGVDKVLAVQTQAQQYLTTITQKLHQQETERVNLINSIEALKAHLGMVPKVPDLKHLVKSDSEDDEDKFIQYNPRQKYKTVRGKNPLEIDKKNETIPALISFEEPIPTTCNNTISYASVVSTKQERVSLLDTDVPEVTPVLVTSTSPVVNKFNAKTPTMRVGLGPPRKGRNANVDRVSSPDIFSAVDDDDNDDGSVIVNSSNSN